MIRLKPGVSLKHLTPQGAALLSIVASCFEELGFVCVVTSGSDGTHSPASLHYTGNALDFRTKHVPRDRLDSLLDFVSKALEGSEFQWLLEKRDLPGEHLHAEYDVT